MHFIRTLALKEFENVRKNREHMHKYPELSFQEYETAKFVSNQLASIGIPFEKEVGGTGVIAFIEAPNAKDKKTCIAFRSELDALPILEENDVDYRSSKEGIMHACGHDVHTSILLGVAKICWENKEKLKESIKLIFQPGEEKTPGGASLLIKEKVLEKPEVKQIYALHVYPELAAGMIGTREGLYMASCDEIHLTIQGKGGHGALPHNCVDPIAIGAEIVLNLQQIVSRKCDPKIPCVLSFGHFEAIGATNVIPETAIIKGTFRTMNEEWRAEALELIQTQIESICSMNGAKAKLHIEKGYPYLENDPETTASFHELAKNYFGSEKVKELPLRLTSEDFSFYAQEIPACFFRLGVRNDVKGIVHGVHHPKFDIDSKALLTGMEAFLLLAFQHEK